MGDNGFIVNNMVFGDLAPAPDPNGYYLTNPVGELKGVTWTKGIPAQGFPGRKDDLSDTTGRRGPVTWLGKAFTDHCLTYRDLNGNGTRDIAPDIEQIYDPSYGVGPFDRLVQWKVNGLAAFMPPGTHRNISGQIVSYFFTKPATAPAGQDPPLEIRPPTIGFALP